MGFYLRTKGGLRGPVDANSLRKLLAAGKLRPESVIRDKAGGRLSVHKALEEPSSASGETRAAKTSSARAQPAESPLGFDELFGDREDVPTVDSGSSGDSPPAGRPRAPRRSAGRNRGAPTPPRRRGAPRATSTRRSSRRPLPRAAGGGSAGAHRIGWAVVSLRISVVIYALVGIAMAAGGALLAQEAEEGGNVLMGMGFGLALVAWGIASAVEWVVRGLQRRRPSARGLGIALGALYLPSVFLPLGILTLLGLTHAGSRAQFER